MQPPPDWSAGLQNCWTQIAQFRQIVREMVNEYLATHPDIDTGGGSTGGGSTATPGASVVISVTTPGNPVTGMQWWNGSILQVYDGSRWNPVGPSTAAGPVPTAGPAGSPSTAP